MDMDRVLEGTVGLLALTEQALISYTFFLFGSEAASCGDRTIAFWHRFENEKPDETPR
jgi:hypothetical protein